MPIFGSTFSSALDVAAHACRSRSSSNSSLHRPQLRNKVADTDPIDGCVGRQLREVGDRHVPVFETQRAKAIVRQMVSARAPSGTRAISECCPPATALPLEVRSGYQWLARWCHPP